MITRTTAFVRSRISGGVALGVGLGIMLAVQAPSLQGQAAGPKLTTVLADLARAVPQRPGGVFGGMTPPLASLPRSVQDAATSRRLRLDANNTIQVYLLLSEVTDEYLQRLRSAGVTIELADGAGRRVQARVPVRNLQQIAALSFVRFIRLPSYARRHSGAVVTDGDAIHAANLARAQFGVDGTGVKVGVISDGLKGVFATKCQTCRGVSGGPIASGDLPEAEGTRRNGVLVSSQGGIASQTFHSAADLEDTPSFFQPCAFRGAGAEGTALLEIVHDIAPGAELAFANADTSLAFNAAVNALAAVNDVVVDDLGFLGEPADGQSSVSRNTADALNNPQNRIRTYITSVGNAANDHYFGAYVDSGRDGRTIAGIDTTGRLHLFQPTSETTDVLGLGDQPYDVISLPTNGEVVVVLTWNDPAGQSANNYDLYLVDDDTGAVVARSTDLQRGGQDALEAIDFLNRGETGLFRIVIQNVGDQAAARNLNLFAFQPQCAVDGPRRLAAGRHERHNYNTPARSVLAQSDAGGSPVSVISVGAICSASAAAANVFAGSDAPSESCHDVSHATIQFFSSRGPTLDGRLKPDLVAIDGVTVTGAGRFPSPFFGTSAAAPHVAGIAALVLQVAPCLRSGSSDALGSDTARAALRDLLVASTDPLGPSIPNMTFGFGLANALRSAQRALPVCSPSAPGPPPPPEPPPPQPTPGTIALNPSVRHQVMHHWEAGVLASVEDYVSLSNAQIGAMLDLAVTDMGITRARLAIRSGVEGPGTRYEIVNDNNDPNVLNDAGFNWTNFDQEVSRWIVPARQRAQARGEPFYTLLAYSDFGQSAFEHYNFPEEYAEFMLAAFRHMQARYGFMPNGIEMVNEPDNSGGAWAGERIGRAMVATAQRFQREGMAVPEFTAPSVTAMPNADGFLNDIYSIAGAKALLTEVAYHRYNMAGDLAALAERARVDGKRMAMLEFWGPSTDHTLLYQDLTEGRNSAWQLGVFGDAYGCQFGQTISLVNGIATICPKNRTVRQYTKYVRPGAQRIDATSQNPVLAPLAFINTNGGYVVVVKASASGSFSISGLPAGTYGIFYTTASEYNVNRPDATISAGQTLSTSIPDDGVITIYRK